MTAHWTASFRPARQVHAPFSSTGPRRPALCIHTHAETCAQARKCGSKRYLGRWAFMATGPIEQVRRNGYTHIKRRGKRFHYSFVYGIDALHCAKTFAREKRRQKVATSYGPRREWDISNEVFRVQSEGGRGRSSSTKTCLRAAQIDDFDHLKLCPS